MPRSLAFYSPEQIETLARALADGAHRDPSRPALSAAEIAARAREDAQDAELIRVAAYAGLRRGELVALRWRDVDFAGRKLIVRRVTVRRDRGAVDEEPSGCARSRFPTRPPRRSSA